MTSSSPSLIEANNVSKRFGAIQALKDVNVQVYQGDIHALVGENGAGKSTLGKVMSGIIRSDSGELLVNGSAVNYVSPRDALRDGITTITQEISLLSKQNVWQNVMLGQEKVTFGFLRKKEMLSRYSELLELTGFDIDPFTKVGHLNLAEQKKVEVLQAIARDANLIIMDEPTAMLSDEETAKFLDVVRNLQAMGKTVIYVSHFLEEVLEIANKVTIMRNGEIIRTTATKDETPTSLVEGMLGKSMEQMYPTKRFPAADAPIVFNVKSLSSDVFDKASLQARAGEIVGIAGLVGSGRSRLVKTLFGAEPIKSSTIEVLGKPIVIKSTADAINAGIFMIPESRKEQGLHLKQSIQHNLSLAQLSNYSKGGLLQGQQEQKRVGEMMKSLTISPALPKNKVSSLSGGNQQKVLFGKWLFEKPTVFIIDEPTRGIDVGAKQAIYQLITDLAKEGMTILMVSSEIEEIMGLSHRVLVMRLGEIVADISADSPDFNEKTIMQAAFGTHSKPTTAQTSNETIQA